MSNKSKFQNVFKRLRHILSNYAGELICVNNEVDNYYLDTKRIMKNKKPLFFGAVQIKKAYVSYHLMPVYIFPELLENISPELKRRMQGKSCFNFKSVDDELFKELAQFTAAGYKRYQQEGYL